MNNETSFEEWWKWYVIAHANKWSVNDECQRKSLAEKAYKAGYEAGVLAENEACAKLADDREKKCHELADKPGYDQDEIDDILSKAFSFSTIANDIRKRQKDKSC